MLRVLGGGRERARAQLRWVEGERGMRAWRSLSPREVSSASTCNVMPTGPLYEALHATR